MNDRHDALYRRARGVLNQNIKRLWFKVNPYLEKKDTLDAHPESPTRFIQPLQSTVLSERLLEQESREHRDLEIGGFWDFLYSDKWSNYCSIRVMEGQLLETLMATLHVLEKDGEVIHKKTHAYARNERERRGCYRLANQKGCTSVQEILLLEFTYFGRQKPPFPNNVSCSSGYPGYSSATTGSFTSPSGFSGNEAYTPFSNFMNESPKPQNIKMLPKRRRRQSAPDFRQNIPREAFRRMSRDPAGILEETNDLDIPDRSVLSDLRDFQASDCRNSQQSHVSSESSDYRTTNSIVRNLSRLPCTERVSYGSGAKLDEQSESNKVDESELLWEEGMYLGDLKSKEVEETVLEKLRKCRNEKNEAKKEMEQLYEEWTKRRISAFKPVSKYAVNDVEESTSITVHYRFLDTVPDFEEFLHILEEDQKFDPRFKRAKQISRKIAKRYNIAKENILGAPTGHEVVDRKKSHSTRLAPGTEKSTDTKKSFRMCDNKQRASSKTPTGSRRLSSYSRNSAGIVEEKTDIEKTAQEVGGVTDSKSCERHVLEFGRRRSTGKMSVSKGVDFRKKKKKTPDAVPTIYLTSPGGANFLLLQPSISKVEAKRRQSTGPIAEVEFEQEPPEHAIPEFDDNKDNADSSDEDREDQSDFQNLFDSRKLNTKYSFERLRGKNYHKKKPAFFGVLRKYYRLQKVADAFADSGAVRQKAKRKSVFHRLLNTTDNLESERDVIGKMKTYNFLYHRRRRKANLDECDFSNLSMAEFRDNLIRALDDFIIRKERVVSNIGAKSTTHITFTRPFIFHHRE